jgi:hypothetical protein
VAPSVIPALKKRKTHILVSHAAKQYDGLSKENIFPHKATENWAARVAIEFANYSLKATGRGA